MWDSSTVQLPTGLSTATEEDGEQAAELACIAEVDAAPVKNSQDTAIITAHLAVSV